MRPAHLADGTPTWSLSLGMPLVIAAAHGRCVVATDAATLEAALHASAGTPAPWPASDAMSVDADLQAIAARLLPLAPLLMGDASAPLADPFQVLRWLSERAVAGDSDAALSAAVAANPGLANGIQAFCGGGLDRLITLVSCHRTPPDHGLQAALVVVKTATGYCVVTQNDAQFDSTAQTLAQVQKLLLGYTKRYGVEVDALPVIALYPCADHHCALALPCRR